MSKLFGENFLTHQYIKRYPESKRIRDNWKDRVVSIQTENGYWRAEACGYAFRHGPVGAYSFSEALSQIDGLGPEKTAKLHCYNSIIKERKDF